MKLKLGALFIFLIFVLPAQADDIEMEPKWLCDYDKLFKLSTEIDLNALEKMEKTLLGLSTEGARAKYFYENNKLKAVKTVFYGETGKFTIAFYFNTPTEYLVETKDYDYSLPITFKSSTIVATSSTKFMVCQGKLIQLFSRGEVIREFENSKNTLIDILKYEPKK